MKFMEDAMKRYSSREFTDAVVEDEKVLKILEAANMAPTAKNLQAYHIWVIKKDEDIEKLNEITPCMFGAKTALVLGVDKKEAWVRPADGNNFAEVDGGIVGTHIWMEIYEQGLASTWVGFMEPDKLKEHFPVMKDHEIIAIFPIGYAANTEKGNPSGRHEKRKELKDTYTEL